MIKGNRNQECGDAGWNNIECDDIDDHNDHKVPPLHHVRPVGEAPGKPLVSEVRKEGDMMHIDTGAIHDPLLGKANDRCGEQQCSDRSKKGAKMSRDEINGLRVLQYEARDVGACRNATANAHQSNDEPGKRQHHKRGGYWKDVGGVVVRFDLCLVLCIVRLIPRGAGWSVDLDRGACATDSGSSLA